MQIKKLITLAQVINKCEEEIICDLAETYHIYITDWLELPKGITTSLVATLVLGLSDNSRTKRKLTNGKLSLEEMLLAVIADRLGVLVWQPTKDGHKGRNQPKSIYKALTEDKKKDELAVFENSDDFEAWYKKTRT